MALNFNNYAAEANAFMKDYAKELGLTEEVDKAGRILIVILHGLREMVSTEESLQFIAQLPMFLKAIYVNGWTIKTEKQRIRTLEDFIELLRSISGINELADFKSDKLVEDNIYSTIRMLRQYVSKGQMDDMKNQLPKQLKIIFEEQIFNKN